MPTNKQRREAARRHLERQLQRRQEREVARRRFTLIASVVGTLVVVAAIVVTVVLLNNSDKGKPAASGKTKTPSASKSPTPVVSPSTTPAPAPAAACVAVPKTGTARFRGLTVTGSLDLKKAPTVTGKSAVNPKTMECRDLVVGTGAAATASSTATVQYVGVVYKSGKVFQSSWTATGQAPPAFPLAPGSVIDGFSQGILGDGPVAPMRVGGRRIIIMPSSEAYGDNPQAGTGIPDNAALVFVVDLTKLAPTAAASSAAG